MAGGAGRRGAAGAPAGMLGLLAAALLACSPGAPPSSAPASAASSAAAPAAASPAAAAPAAPAPAAPVAQPAAPAEPARVRITDIQITSAAGSYIAAEKGYFQEEGILADFIPSGTDQIPPLVADQADVAGAVVNAYLFNAFARSIPVRIVADHGANLPGASAGGIVVRKDLVDSGAYQGPASLRGWKVATAVAGSVADVARDRWLRSGGVSDADLEFVSLTFPDILVAFGNKAIDAAGYQEPFTTIAVERGLAVRVAPGHEMYLNQQIGVLLFGERLLQDRSLALRYVRAYTRGVRDYVKAMIDRDPAAFDEVVPILIAHTTVKERALFERAMPSGLRADPIPNAQSMADDQEWFVAQGLVTQRINVQDMLDLSFVQEAIRELGPAQR
jgi:NitT/TauT family transport system substrate-binding protein